MSETLHHDHTATSDGTIPSLVTGIVQDAQKLIVQQIELVRQEVKEDIRNLAWAAAFISVGAGLCAISLILLCFMGVYLLQYLLGLELWLCFLIAGGSFLVLGAVLLYAAVYRLTHHNPLPDQTLMALKENLQWKTNPK